VEPLAEGELRDSGELAGQRSEPGARTPGAPARRQVMAAAARVVVPPPRRRPVRGLLDPADVEQPPDHRLRGARGEPHLVVGARGHLLADGVPVPVLVDQRAGVDRLRRDGGGAVVGRAALRP
jgi:hypothetical protein